MKNIVLVFICALGLAACAGQVLKQSGKDYQQGNYNAAMQKLQPLADKGDPKAEYAIGYMYYYGQGVMENKKEGEMWIHRAADQGFAPALKALDVIQRQKALNPLSPAAPATSTPATSTPATMPESSITSASPITNADDPTKPAPTTISADQLWSSY